MILPSCFVARSDAAESCPLIVLDRASYPAWREQQPAPTQGWLDGNNFQPVAGSFLLLPGADGRPAGVVAAIADAGDPLALAHLPMLLPAGDYRVQTGAPVPVDALLTVLGWGLGAYKFDRYLAPLRPPARLVLEDALAADHDSFAELRSSLLVRDLVNTPTEHMGPADLEAVALRLAQAYGGELKSVVGEDLLTLNFPTIHAVGRASHRPPRLIELNWGEPRHPHVAIVGKGVCFDTGGLDIKAADGMRNMKKDMGGAAHALALAQLVMALKLPIRLTLLVPAVENAIAGNAFRPGEVIVTRQGLSVEVDNTDAEGRLVLCDALAYAAEQKPALILDFATLTGAARIALGPDLPMLFCNDETLAAEYLAAGERSRDRVWRMPLWRPYLTYLKSTVADLANSGPSRMAGAVVAALYLERFVPEGQPWAHVDVYSWNDSDRPGKPAGGEAQGLRAALELLRTRFPRSHNGMGTACPDFRQLGRVGGCAHTARFPTTWSPMNSSADLLKELRIDRRPGAARKKRRWPILVGAGVAVLVALFLVMGARPVEVETAKARSAAEGGPASVLDASGYVTARRIATVSSKITGKVKEVLIEEGQRVAEGEILARLDPVDANAQRQLAGAQLGSAQSQLAEAQAQLTLAERNLVRQRQLAAQKLIAAASLDAVIAERDSRRARLLSVQRGVRVASDQLNIARLGEDNTIIRAPFAGVIVTKAAQPGEMISPISGGGGSIRTGIGTLVDMDSLEVQVDVNEAYIGRVQSKMPVEAVLNAYPEWKIPGAVIAIIPTADRSKATVKVRIQLDTKDPRIVPDMGVRVSFLETRKPGAAKPAGVWVPTRAVQTKDGKSAVFVVDGDEVKRVAVTAGEMRDVDQLVSSGLKGGETVVLSPPDKLKDGSRVSIKKS